MGVVIFAEANILQIFQKDQIDPIIQSQTPKYRPISLGDSPLDYGHFDG